MNPYIEMKQRHQAEVNAFPMKFAFTQESLERGMRELGLDPKKDMDKIVAIPGGGFIRESDKQAFLDLFARHDKERKEAIEEIAEDPALSDAFLNAREDYLKEAEEKGWG